MVSQHIRTIQEAVQEHLPTLELEGSRTHLVASCGIFITLNPEYAGRSELPDNLKTLLRPVSMVVADFDLIAEISLLEQGFTEARALAHRIVQTFKVAAAQLSPQQHYHFGMRSIAMTVTVAGSLAQLNSCPSEVRNR